MLAIIASFASQKPGFFFWYFWVFSCFFGYALAMLGFKPEKTRFAFGKNQKNEALALATKRTRFFGQKSLASIARDQKNRKKTKKNQASS